MGQQQGKQGVAGYPPPMEGVSAVPIVSSAKVPPVSRIKGLKPRQPKESSWSPVITGGIAIGAGPPSAAGLGLFNEIPNGKPCIDSSSFRIGTEFDVGFAFGCLLLSFSRQIENRKKFVKTYCYQQRKDLEIQFFRKSKSVFLNSAFFSKISKSFMFLNRQENTHDRDA